MQHFVHVYIMHELQLCLKQYRSLFQLHNTFKCRVMSISKMLIHCTFEWGLDLEKKTFSMPN